MHMSPTLAVTARLSGSDRSPIQSGIKVKKRFVIGAAIAATLTAMSLGILSERPADTEYAAVETPAPQ